MGACNSFRMYISSDHYLKFSASKRKSVGFFEIGVAEGVIMGQTLFNSLIFMITKTGDKVFAYYIPFIGGSVLSFGIINVLFNERLL